MAGKLRALEFFSGLGALGQALKQAMGDGATVLESFEISDVANDTFEHNWGRRPLQGNIEVLTAAQLDRYAAEVWLLSPPCQPYTRQGLQRDAQDFRAAPFHSLLGRLAHMKHPPRHLLVENVVGFERSDSHRHALRMLRASGFLTAGFILSPELYGYPNSRHRYYLLAAKAMDAHSAAPWAHLTPLLAQLAAASVPSTAVLGVPPRPPQQEHPDARAAHAGKRPRSPDASEEESHGAPAQEQLQGQEEGQLPDRATSLQGVTIAGRHEADTGREHEQDHPIFMHPPYALEQLHLRQAAREEHAQAHQQEQHIVAIDLTPIRPLSRFLVQQPCPLADRLSSAPPGPSSPPCPGSSGAQQAVQCEAADASVWQPFQLMQRVLEQCGDVLDVVTPASRRSKTFTKSYTQKVKGSGSVLCTLPEFCDHPEECSRQRVHARAAQLVSATEQQRQQQQQQAHDPDACPLIAAAPQRKPGLHALAPVLDKALMVAEWKRMQLRFFTPREIANLHGLPSSFGFPPRTSLRQRYKLLGNSLHVTVVADLIALLLRPPVTMDSA